MSVVVKRLDGLRWHSLGPGDFVFNGDPATPGTEGTPTTTQFLARLLWPNSWMDEDATWYGSRPWSRPHCIRRGPRSARNGHSSPHLFGPCLLWTRSPISATAELLLKFGNISRSYRQEGCFTYSVPRGTVLRKDKEFAIDFTYDIKKLLLTVVTLVSPLILT